MYSGINSTKAMSLPRTKLVRYVKEYSPMVQRVQEQMEQSYTQSTVDPTALYAEEWKHVFNIQEWREEKLAKEAAERAANHTSE